MKIALAIHVFYMDTFEAMTKYLHIAPRCDVFITFPLEFELNVRQIFKPLKHKFSQTTFLPCDNKGKDILPFLSKTGPLIMEYDLVCKLHTKKSVHSPFLSDWSDFLFYHLIGNEKIIKKNKDQFQNNPRLGIISPPWFSKIGAKPYQWDENEPAASRLSNHLHLNLQLEKMKDYPAGSMFWFRPQSLWPLISGDVVEELFESENSQYNGTMAHAVERMFHLIAQKQGFETKIIRNIWIDEIKRKWRKNQL